MTDESASTIEAWNTVLFEKFSRFRHLLTQGLSGHSEELFRRHPFVEGQRVLDVGSGFGDTAQRIASMVGAHGRVTGVDCASKFVALASREASEQGLANTEFRVGDVQTADLQGPYDRVFSRFGTMFFSSPGAALRNIRRALAPGAPITVIVWRRREDNPWLHEAELRVRELVPVKSHEETDQVHCGPGPFSMAGADLVSDLLTSSGFTEVALERFDTDICIGRSVDEAIEFAMALGPAGEILRLAGEEGVRQRDNVMRALRPPLEAFEASARNTGREGVWAPSSTWFVTARNR
jgi:ubiquinone/menaquinone biosynthesis C-methylase UbiE